MRKELRDGKVVWTGTHTYRHAVHLHEVTEAAKHLHKPEGLFVPERVGSAMHLVPRWLRPHLCWVTGTQVRERVVERDLRTEKWEYADPSRREIWLSGTSGWLRRNQAMASGRSWRRDTGV